MHNLQLSQNQSKPCHNQIQNPFDAKNKLDVRTPMNNTYLKTPMFFQIIGQHSNTLTISLFGIFLAKSHKLAFTPPFCQEKTKEYQERGNSPPSLPTSHLIFQLPLHWYGQLKTPF